MRGRRRRRAGGLRRGGGRGRRAPESYKRQCSEGREAGAGADRPCRRSSSCYAREGFRGAQEEAQGFKDPAWGQARRAKNGLAVGRVLRPEGQGGAGEDGLVRAGAEARSRALFERLRPGAAGRRGARRHAHPGRPPGLRKLWPFPVALSFHWLQPAALGRAVDGAQGLTASDLKRSPR